VREVYSTLVKRKDVREECDVKEDSTPGGAAPKGVDSEADGAEPSVSSSFSPVGWSK